MDKELQKGYLLAIAAFVFWGVAPIYFKFLEGVSPLEIVAQRVFWSLITLSVFLYFLQKEHLFTIHIELKKHFKVLSIATVLLSVNWLIFIYAISNDKILEASLGYYINPLINIALGAIVLGERFTFIQKIAIGLVFIGVFQEIVRFGQVPLISLSLALTFGVYGLIKKNIDIDGTRSLLIETIIMFPVAALYLAYIFYAQSMSFYFSSLSNTLLLPLAGLVTSIPLLLYISASKRIKYSAIGLFQYIAPTLMALIGFYFYNETFPPGRLMTFSLVWAGILLIIFSHLKTNYDRSK